MWVVPLIEYNIVNKRKMQKWYKFLCDLLYFSSIFNIVVITWTSQIQRANECWGALKGKTYEIQLEQQSAISDGRLKPKSQFH